MKRFIDIIIDNLTETNDPLEGLSYEPQQIPVTKEVPVSQKSEVNDTQENHIEQQLRALVNEMERQIKVVEEHIKEKAFHSARLGLEALETLQQQARDLEVERAKLHEKTSTEKTGE